MLYFKTNTGYIFLSTRLVDGFELQMIRKKGGSKFPLLGCLPACGIPSSLSEESSLQNFSSKGSLSGVTGASDGWCPQPGREG